MRCNEHDGSGSYKRRPSTIELFAVEADRRERWRCDRSYRTWLRSHSERAATPDEKKIPHPSRPGLRDLHDPVVLRDSCFSDAPEIGVGSNEILIVSCHGLFNNRWYENGLNVIPLSHRS